MIPKLGKYYYINYVDKIEPAGSYDGIALCVGKYEYNEAGDKLREALYEFEHPQGGKKVLSLFTAAEIILEAV